jgi:hypothetical protein
VVQNASCLLFFVFLFLFKEIRLFYFIYMNPELKMIETNNAIANDTKNIFLLSKQIKFYALGNRPTGAALMARAAMQLHAAALYSLAVIQFNGSGGSKHHRDLRAGFALCFRAAACGGIDALRELAYCLQVVLKNLCFLPGMMVLHTVCLS